MGKLQNECLFKDLTEQIIKCAFEVHNVLGYGFLEKVYENALVIELKQNGIKTTQQVPISVSYKGENVGEYTADILVEEKVIIELKAIEEIINTTATYFSCADLSIRLYSYP